MKKFLMFLCAVMLVFGMVGSASAMLFTGTPSPNLNPTFGTLIDFDDQATGTAILFNDYVSYGVSSITETEGLGSFGRYGSSQSAPNYVGTGTGGERGTDANMGWDGTILIELQNYASMVGIGIANSRGGPEYISVYNANMALIEKYQVQSGSNVYSGIDRGGLFDIKYFEITGDFFAIDDLQFDSGGASVPEPSTMLLMGTGLLGLLGYSRKRFSKKS